MADVAGFVNRRVRFIILLGIAATWIGLLGDVWWFFDLFSHFRLQYIAICLVAVPWFLSRRSLSGAAASAAGLFVNGGLLLGLFGSSPSRPAAPDFQLRVVSINVHTSNRSAGEVIKFVRHADADLVFLMEVDEWWANELAPLKQMYPHSLIESREDNFGVAFFSRVEGIRSRIKYFGSVGVPSVVAELRQNGKGIRFIGTHPLPPTGAGNSALRDEQLAEVCKFAGNSDVPVLLAGDLNATPWSAGMRLLVRDGSFQMPVASTVWSPTWMSNWPVAVSIDHALATPPLVVLRREVGPDVGSDHRPVTVDVGWEQ